MSHSDPIFRIARRVFLWLKEVTLEKLIIRAESGGNTAKRVYLIIGPNGQLARFRVVKDGHLIHCQLVNLYTSHLFQSARLVGLKERLENWLTEQNDRQWPGDDKKN